MEIFSVKFDETFLADAKQKVKETKSAGSRSTFVRVKPTTPSHR